MSVHEKVLEESRILFDQMEQLREKYGGRWVVFKDGKVQSDHSTEKDAFVAAVESYGLDGEFVVDLIEPKDPVPITASVLYGL